MSSLPAHSSSEELHHRRISLTQHSAFRAGAVSLCGSETKNKHIYLNRFLIKHQRPPQKLFFFGKSALRYSRMERHRESVIYLQGIQICIKALFKADVFSHFNCSWMSSEGKHLDPFYCAVSSWIFLLTSITFCWEKETLSMVLMSGLPIQ